MHASSRTLLAVVVMLVVSVGCRHDRTQSGSPVTRAHSDSTSEEAMDVQAVTDRMDAFAARTGLSSDQRPRRYLWTDAFAVCTELGLARATGDERHLDRARALVDQVHHVLGRHREDEPREGWISGYSPTEGEEHPTAGGLRIGKPLPERGPDEPFDERLEWDRDGQYFHYLTKWMHALDLMARETGEARYNVWARELAERAYERFTYASGAGARRMYWKMSIDLSRPQVPSMGAHDPLDGWVTYRQLAATARILEDAPAEPKLDRAIEGFDAMLDGDFTTTDPLGLGGLLMDATRLAQIDAESQRLVDILRSALAGLRRWSRSGALSGPATRRLAFRELGLAIGLAGVEQMMDEGWSPDSTVGELLTELQEYLPLRDRIVDFWSEPEQQAVRTWTEHREINEVMLATALVPDGCLSLSK